MNVFDSNIIEHSDIITTFKGKELILKNVRYYNGPITMQLLPNGGIQSVYKNKLIIKFLNGFIFCDIVIYDKVLMSSKEFINMFEFVVNEVLPN